jgi:hypothetical protein
VKVKARKKSCELEASEKSTVEEAQLNTYLGCHAHQTPIEWMAIFIRVLVVFLLVFPFPLFFIHHNVFRRWY